MEEIPFRRKTINELEALTYEEREAYCDALLAELKRVHREFGERISQGENSNAGASP